MSTDRTFFTNEGEDTLLARFRALVQHAKFFDVLVGYFYTSGFHALYQSLESTEKIRILIGISTNRETLELITKAKSEQQTTLPLAAKQVKIGYAAHVAEEMETSPDTAAVAGGVQKFMEWMQSGKLEIRAYPSANIHAKVYIMTFDEQHGAISTGHVITGSSNFTRAGLQDNLEFNVELKNRGDYGFAKEKFEELWQRGVDVSDEYVRTIRERTWLNDTITPHQLYLKFLYEYFKDDLRSGDDAALLGMPAGFKDLEYQRQAVLNAKKILEEYGGVFLSDVVGLGKTFMAALLAKQLDGSTLVIAPPVLLEKENPGSWRNVMLDVGVPAEFESIGQLHRLVQRGSERFKNVIVDEAHRFRSESNVTYERLAEICRGKRVILVTATPYNNAPRDVLNQIKLFQKAKKSTIPNLPDLEVFFKNLERRLKGLDRTKDREVYLQCCKENAKEIRDRVLKHLMVRRTRTEIERYYGDDLHAQGFHFPRVEHPQPVFYQLNREEDRLFMDTIQRIARDLKYARYAPMLYYIGEDATEAATAQRNMRSFMRVLLIKRLESSFHAFRCSLGRFIASYEAFLKTFDDGSVYVSKDYANKILEILGDDDEERVQQLVESKKAERYDARDFREEFRAHLAHDLEILKELRDAWMAITRDPKVDALVTLLRSTQPLREQKLILFTESRETAEYLAEQLRTHLGEEPLLFTGRSKANERDVVIANFDAKARVQEQTYRILITTDLLAEGVNLHRANIVLNYDIPWNPTRLMQRVGRINRVDTTFDSISTYNCFPTEQADSQLKLRSLAEAKVAAFMTLLGADAPLLTEGDPVSSHELFSRINAREVITGEDETEESALKYLHAIKDVQENDPDLFEAVKRLPKKARTARRLPEHHDALLTYFRKGRTQKFFLGQDATAAELDFMAAAELLEADARTPRQPIPQAMYDLLDVNKRACDAATTEEVAPTTRGTQSAAAKLLRLLKAVADDTRRFTEEDEEYWRLVQQQLEEGGLPRHTVTEAYREVERALHDGPDAYHVLAALQKRIPDTLLQQHLAERTTRHIGPREVILSEYFTA
ncbi:helicase [Candidatus Uhrbacteria bacterium]|nr:helicase [Candidatus Uhrbacteria bacterium]